jgi:hypothetical protein
MCMMVTDHTPIFHATRPASAARQQRLNPPYSVSFSQ